MESCDRCGWEKDQKRLHPMKCPSWEERPRRECGYCLGPLTADGCELVHEAECPHRRQA
jgi:hypothetical protein